MASMQPKRSRSNLLRWIARIWSLLVVAFVVLMIFSPDPYATGEPVPMEDWVMLGFWGLAVLGLLIAWRWERAGSILTLAVMPAREVAWVLIKGRWMVEFLIAWVFLVTPAVLFLLAWRLDRRQARV